MSDEPRRRFRAEIRRTFGRLLRWEVLCYDNDWPRLVEPDRWFTITHTQAVRTARRWIETAHRREAQRAEPSEVIE